MSAAQPAAPAPPSWQTGGYCRALPGYAQCGDAFFIDTGADGTLRLALVDGLGHGTEAAIAAMEAVRVVREGRATPVGELMQRCNAALQPTRGAAIGMLTLAPDGKGEFCGIGNVEVQSLAGDPPGLFCLAGIVGHNMRTLRVMPFTMRPGDIYCLHSDGVSSRANLRACLPGLPADVARRIVDEWGRSHDDASAVILGYDAGSRLQAAPA